MKKINHQQNLENKIQAWFPNEDLDNILDILSEPEAGGIPAEAYQKMEKLIDKGIDESIAFYEIYDNWDETILKSYIEKYIAE